MIADRPGTSGGNAACGRTYACGRARKTFVCGSSRFHSPVGAASAAKRSGPASISSACNAALAAQAAPSGPVRAIHFFGLYCHFRGESLTTIRCQRQSMFARRQIAGKQLVFGIRRTGNRMFLGRPGSQIDQFAALAAEWPGRVGGTPFHGGAAGRALDGCRAHDWPPRNVR